MAKLLIKAMTVFLAGFVVSGVASAVKLAVNEDATPEYAAELFGEGADDIVLEYGDENDFLYAYLAIPHGRGDGTDTETFDDPIAPGSVATLTVRVEGAVFQSPIRGSNISLADMVETRGAEMAVTVSFGDYSGAGDAELEPKNREGGGRGESEVTFDIEVLDGAIPNSFDVLGATDGDMQERHAIRIAIPPLTETAAAMGPLGRGIRLYAELNASRVAADTFPDFPTRAQVRSGDHRRTLIPSVYDGDSALTAITLVAPLTSWEAFGGTPQRKAYVMATDRTQLNPRFLGPSRAGQFVRLSTVSVTVGDRLQADGNPFSVNSRTGGGSGDLLIAFSGNIRDGDVIAFDLNGNSKADSGEMLDVEAGQASGTFDLDGLLIDPTADPETTKPVSRPVLYFPNGKDPMRDGALNGYATVLFDEVSNDGSNVLAGIGASLVYDAGTPIEAFALAPTSSGDETNVRARCGSSRPCHVFISCDSVGGTNYFGRMADPLDPWSVRTMNTGMIADVVGAEDADFAGRMSCHIIGATEVQVLTRSNGVLVNNSYVGDGS